MSAASASPTAVLFVDDEPELLESYRRAAATLCPDWTVLLSTSGEEALRLLAATAVDVVIADIGMEGGMDGTALQREICFAHPAIIRVILSGRIDSTAIIESSKWSEIRLCKPAPMALIRTHIEQALAARGRSAPQAPAE
jgi:DNA-binding NarL/FixJ family response regulator